MDLGVLPGRRQLPVAVDVAVPVEAAAKAGFFVGLCEIGQIGFAQPGRQRTTVRDVAKKSLTCRDEQRRSRIGKSASEHGSHRRANVAFELAFGYSRRLKILPVEIRDAAFAQG